jgi:hypothetical protein
MLALAPFPTKLLELRFEIPEPFPVKRLEFRIPATVNDVNCPTDVMLGWEGVITDCDVGTVETFEPFTFDRPEALPTWRLALRIPETVKEVKVPTDVMLGWEGVITD